MSTLEPKYWPFPVPSDDLTDEHRKLVKFLEEAFKRGYRPRMFDFGGGEYEAETAEGRKATLVSRGGYCNGATTRWEVAFEAASERVADYWVNDFETGAASVLQWLGGETIREIIDAAQPAIIRGPRIDATYFAERSAESPLAGTSSRGGRA
ncbi:MAG TPA: hypothetical protein VGI99_07780 [Gemmataceae bacterium]|jgi:hypothetical protein